MFNNFGVFFHPNDHQTIAEAYRTLKPGGIAGFASWKSITWWPEIALPAMRKFLPQAPALPEKLTVFPTTGWTEVASVLSKLEGAGFQDVNVTEYAFTPVVEPEDFAEAMAVLVRVIASRVWSKEDLDQYGTKIEGALLRYMRDKYTGGRWDGQMLALITTGRKP